MKHLCSLAAILVSSTGLTLAVGFMPVDSSSRPQVFLWSDTCNAYVVRDGDAALLVDLGDGSVLDHLGEIGVKRVEWVLFTHHHREQCQGAQRLAGMGIAAACPEAEREIFEEPSRFRKMNVSLGDNFTIHGSSFIRPPIQSIPIRRGLMPGEVFQWHGRGFHCLDTAGNSPGSLTYLLQGSRGLLAFSGDVMLAGARMHTWFDTEWDYGFAAGIKTLRESVRGLSGAQTAMLFPYHRKVIEHP